MVGLGVNLGSVNPELVAALQKMLIPEDQIFVTSVYPLSKEELSLIKKKLLGKDDPEALIENTVDPTILGGLIIKTDNYYFDYSLRGQLQAVSQKLNF
jgi:F0F1-type ATP synthase delta subunit